MTDLLVIVDPAVGDWQPICFSCQEPVESWAEAVVVPAGRTEDDEPDCLVVAHLECPRVAAEHLKGGD